MKIKKISKRDDVTGELVFDSVDVRRLQSILLDHYELSAKAMEQMRSWLENGEDTLTLDEAIERLSYYLDRMNIR